MKKNFGKKHEKIAQIPFFYTPYIFLSVDLTYKPIKAGEEWGVDGDLMVDEEGNLEIDDDDQLEGKGAGGEEDGWDVGDDLALPADIDVGKIGGDETDFTVPTHGQPPSTHWTNNSRLVFDQVAAGDFDSAARLLLDQLGVRNLEPFKHLFLTTHGKI